jgi:hypothetical protein
MNTVLMQLPHRTDPMTWQFLSDVMDLVTEISKAIIKASTNLSKD